MATKIDSNKPINFNIVRQTYPPQIQKLVAELVSPNEDERSSAREFVRQNPETAKQYDAINRALIIFNQNQDS